jgi:hypothetical protein
MNDETRLARAMAPWDCEAHRERQMLSGDERDVLAARDSPGRLLGLRAVDP